MTEKELIRIIYDEPLESLSGTTIDLSSCATECRYRLIHCSRFVDEKRLCIIEGVEPDIFPPTLYCAISYVWKGKPSNQNVKSFLVRGAEEGGSVSVDVLRHACEYAAQVSQFIWLDRLCIMQTSSEDKAWQIARMYWIYKHCRMCIVLPGGIQRLVKLHEETTWMHRGWTLQELLAPQRSVVLFSWKDGPQWRFAPESLVNWPPTAIAPGESAVWGMYDLLTAYVAKQLKLRTKNGAGTIVEIDGIRLFGTSTYDRNAIMTIQQAMHTMQPAAEWRLWGIWRASFMRTSSRPVDMVFCIMGLFGVTLNPKAFHPSDREGATVALAREVLKKGHGASWLGMFSMLPPSKQLAFPEFPRTSVPQRAQVNVGGFWRDVTEIMDKDEGFSGAPKGKLDADGYLIFSGKSAGLRRCASQRASRGPQLKAVDGSWWEVLDQNMDTIMSSVVAEAYAVVVAYIGFWGTMLQPRALVIQQHEPRRFHIASYIDGKREKTLREIAKDWKEREFAVGGIGTEQVGIQ